MTLLKASQKVKADLSHPNNVSTAGRVENGSKSKCVTPALDGVNGRYGAISEQMVT